MVNRGNEWAPITRLGILAIEIGAPSIQFPKKREVTSHCRAHYCMAQRRTVMCRMRIVMYPTTNQ